MVMCWSVFCVDPSSSDVRESNLLLEYDFFSSSHTLEVRGKLRKGRGAQNLADGSPDDVLQRSLKPFGIARACPQIVKSAAASRQSSGSMTRNKVQIRCRNVQGLNERKVSFFQQLLYVQICVCAAKDEPGRIFSSPEPVECSDELGRDR